MRDILRFLLKISAIVHVGTAFNVPDRFANGVYEITFIENSGGLEGTIAQYHIQHDVNFTAKYPDYHIPLPKDDVECAEYVSALQQYHDPADEVRAMEMLSNWCERYNLRKGAVAVALYNDAIWYVCNWDTNYVIPSNEQVCSRTEIYAANLKFDRKCKQGRAGELHTKVWLKHYGRGVRKGSICNGLEQIA